MAVTAIMISQNGSPVGFEVTGHAGYAPHGQDIVCSGISTVVTGGINALVIVADRDKLTYEYKAESGNMSFMFASGVTSETVEAIMMTIHTQLETVQETYPQHITIKYMEV